MDKKKFKSRLPVETRNFLRQVVLDSSRVDVIYRMAADHFSDTQVELFERFIRHPGFEKFIAPRRATSLSRFERTLELLIKRIALGISPETIASIAGRMSGTAYRRVEKSFFMVPVDRKSFELFERHFVSVGEQKIDLLAPFVEFCDTTAFRILKDRYLVERPIFEEIMSRLVALLLAKQDGRDIEKAADLLVEPHLVRVIFLSHDIGRSGELLLNLFNLMLRHREPSFFFKLLKLFSMRYPIKKHLSKEKREREHAFLYRRLAQIWNFLYILPEDRLNDYKMFLKDYGNPRDEFETFVWDLVFGLEPEKTLKAVAIFVSTVFSSLRGFYGFTTEVVKFLIKNIVIVISEMNIRDIGTSLYKIVLKLLVGLKVDKKFLERRATFFKWMKEQTSSTTIELEVIRLLLFEYIFIALKQVDNVAHLKMTKFCDDNHRFFCHHIDELYANPQYMRNRKERDVFVPVLSQIRSMLWKPHLERFAGYVPLVEKIISIAEATQTEDGIFMALPDVEPEHIESYYESLMNIFMQDPARTHMAIAPDYWYRVTLADAMPHIKGVLMPLIGGIPVLDGGADAKTNGRFIYLPAHISFFKDPPDPLVENRNLTAYIFCALHEAGHIIAGTFVFDLRFYTSNLERPDLFFRIYNTFEDYRIENYLIRIGAHPQIADLVYTMNNYFSKTFLTKDLGVAVRMLTHIVDEAGGYNSDFRTTPDYTAILNGIMNAELNTGRFRGKKEMIEYGIERLRNLDTANPLGVYPLVREFYEIMKHWHESDLNGLIDSGSSMKPQHDYDAAKPSETPYTADDLDDLYRAYNEDPLSFLQQYGIDVPGDMSPRGKKPGGDNANAVINTFAAEMLETEQPDYSQAGIIDYSHRTRADDESARVQTGEFNVTTTKDISRKEETEETKEKAASREKGRKKYIYSIDPRTRSRTRLSEISEFTVRDTDISFFKKFKQWEYLAQKVYDRLSVLLPIIKEEEDTSSFEGELNIELLIELLSDRNRMHSAEFLDIYRERRRTLEVIIGIDASGSTSFPLCGVSAHATGGIVEVLDIEKAFAVILGTALAHITDRVSTYAFNSLTSTNIYRAETIEAVSSFKAINGNRDGDFIRYINNILDRSDAEVKYFFLLSDGMPASDNYMGKEALDDTLIAMRETVNSGIKLIYFNIDSKRREYFDTFREEATYAEHFTNPEQLLPVLPELVGKIVDSIK